jgi:DNA mismatch endonuclease (patch repair protein)
MVAGSLSRSENMARIRGRDTAPEVRLRRLLRRAGLRPRVHPRLPGAPDMAFVRRRLTIFLDGCFWHGCPQHYIAPKTRFSFWLKKLGMNVERDVDVDADLATRGFQVLRVWQHELARPEVVVARVSDTLADGRPTRPGFAAGTIWWVCQCGSSDAQVVAVSGPGSLKPAGRVRPEAVRLRCRNCGRRWDRAVPQVLV